MCFGAQKKRLIETLLLRLWLRNKKNNFKVSTLIWGSEDRFSISQLLVPIFNDTDNYRCKPN